MIINKFDSRNKQDEKGTENVLIKMVLDKTP